MLGKGSEGKGTRPPRDASASLFASDDDVGDAGAWRGAAPGTTSIAAAVSCDRAAAASAAPSRRSPTPTVPAAGWLQWGQISCGCVLSPWGAVCVFVGVSVRSDGSISSVQFLQYTGGLVGACGGQDSAVASPMLIVVPWCSYNAFGPDDMPTKSDNAMLYPTDARVPAPPPLCH